MNKRQFLKSTLGLSLAPSLAQLLAQPAAADDELYWAQVRKAYRIKPDYINLENGYYNILPEVTLEKHIQHIRDVNYQGAYYMRTMQFPNRKEMSKLVAEVVHCSPDDLILTRNTTESLDMIIGGFPWQVGDEAVYAIQDYGAMQDMFEQVARRHGVVLKKVSVPLHPANDEEIVELYANAITNKTKLLMVCHMVNVTGQILPIRKICDMAHAKGVEVMVDGAHAVAHIEFNLPDLHCDYYGASLHKWLAVPLGVGMLYVKPEHVNKIWPVFAENEKAAKGIERLNHLGTNPVHAHLAIQDAVAFYHQLGPARKEARLRYLQQYWTKQVRNHPGILLNTPEDPKRHGAIANVGVANLKPAELAKRLLEEYQIYTVAIDGNGVHGCRITPNVFTSTAELDQLVRALMALA
jgi:selenocysteine lyase/cysteine desulfurase